MFARFSVLPCTDPPRRSITESVVDPCTLVDGSVAVIVVDPVATPEARPAVVVDIVAMLEFVVLQVT